MDPSIFSKAWHPVIDPCMVPDLVKKWLDDPSVKLVFAKRGDTLWFRSSDSEPISLSRKEPGESGRQVKTCEHCGIEFVAAGTAIGNNRRFCSHKCNGIFQRTKRGAKAVELWNEGRTLGEIAEELGVSRQAIYQTLVIRKDELKEPLGEKRHKRAKPPNAPCQRCGKEVAMRGNKYCSKECVDRKYAETIEGSQFRTVKLICSGCGIEFERTGNIERISQYYSKHGRKYCSLFCYRKNGMSKGTHGKKVDEELETA